MCSLPSFLWITWCSFFSSSWFSTLFSERVTPSFSFSDFFSKFWSWFNSFSLFCVSLVMFSEIWSSEIVSLRTFSFSGCFCSEVWLFSTLSSIFSSTGVLSSTLGCSSWGCLSLSIMTPNFSFSLSSIKHNKKTFTLTQFNESLTQKGLMSNINSKNLNLKYKNFTKMLILLTFWTKDYFLYF